MPIHPGAQVSNGCTYNFVVTDGTDVYIGTARHCTGAIGDRLGVAGVPGTIGTVAYRGVRDTADWAFIRIDASARPLVDGTMAGIGGPSRGPTGLDVRAPEPGEALVHYGWGVATQGQAALRGRVAVALFADDLLSQDEIWFVGSVSGGDSGSPVRLATGEAAGIVVAGVEPVGEPTLAFATRFDHAMDDLAQFLGKPVTLVEGRATVE
ncbi:MAG: chymotrypsin family serine protease [Thermoplasmatota archaeon]